MRNALRLIPTLDSAQLGSACYLFDRRAESCNVLHVPTQKVSPEMSRVVQTLRRSAKPGEARTMSEWQALFNEPADVKRLNTLLAAGYLEPDPAGPSGAMQADGASDNPAESDGARWQAPDAEGLEPARALLHFRRSAIKHYFKPPVFFNLPAQIDSADVHVGLVGIPVSSVSESSGTVHAPDRLRQLSQNAGFWFDFHASGVYTEVGCDDSGPRLICQDVMIKDFGNIGQDARTVGDLFECVDSFLCDQILPAGIRPVFYGGDHAITFPVVSALLKHHPDLVLIHLDAHNDLFYTQVLEYSHASPLLGLLLHGGLGEVHSFGLRTHADPRVGAFRALSGHVIDGRPLADRLHLHSLSATRRRLADPESLSRHLADSIGANTPCYLTIDLDVLSASAMNDQLSTPAGAGLEFQELYELLTCVTDSLNVIGADIVEYSVAGDARDTHGLRELTVLSLQLIDGLHRSACRNASTQPVLSAGIPAAKEPDPSGGESAGRGPNDRGRTDRGPKSPEGVDREPCGYVVRHVPSVAGLNLQPIRRCPLSSLSYETFLTDFVLPGKPVVLTGCDMGTGMRDWSFEYFRQHIPETLSINYRHYRSAFDHDAAQTGTTSLRDMLATLQQRQAQATQCFPERYNIVDWGFGFHLPAFHEDVPSLPWFDVDINTSLGFDQQALKWIYFGEPGTGSPTHIDIINTHAWLLLARGRKAWRMVQEPHAAACFDGSSWADLFSPDRRRFPQMNRVPILETVQEPGEIVWTPSRCVHGVRNLDYSIAITQNYADLSNLCAVHHALTREGPFGMPSTRELPSLTELFDLARKRIASSELSAQMPILMGHLMDQLRQRHDAVEAGQAERRRLLQACD